MNKTQSRKDYSVEEIRRFRDKINPMWFDLLIAGAEGKTTIEIATMFNLKVGTVKSRLNRGRHRLRECANDQTILASK